MFVLTVDGMSCQNCIRHVTAAIRSQDPKAIIEIKLAENLVYVETKTDLEKIKRALDNDGYHVLQSEIRP